MVLRHSVVGGAKTPSPFKCDGKTMIFGWVFGLEQGPSCSGRYCCIESRGGCEAGEVPEATAAVIGGVGTRPTGCSLFIFSNSYLHVAHLTLRSLCC